MFKRILVKLKRLLGRLGRFTVTVIKDFINNKGLLLAGGVGYNALLSVVPLFIIILIFLSKFFEQDQILKIVSIEMRFIIPARTERVTQAIAAFVSEREVVGGIVLAVMIFFSSLAFRMFEDAISIIFQNHARRPERKFWVSALLPFLFIGLLCLGLMLLTGVTIYLDALAGRQISLFGFKFSLSPISGFVLYLSGFCGLTFTFTLLYKIMPVVKVRFRRALAGGIIAALLWESVRRLIVWYLENISLINVLYGSLATVIILLLSMEIAAGILLLGAQVIAELEKNADEGLPWYGADPAGGTPADD